MFLLYECFYFLICCLFLSKLSFQGASVLISWKQSLFTVILEPKKIKSVTVSIFLHLFALKGPDAVTLVFWLLSFKPVYSLSSFTFIKRLFTPSSLSAIRVVLSFAYLRLLIFLPAILIPACDSSNLAFQMMYCAYKLNKQVDNIHPCHTPFPILKQSVIPYLVLTVSSWSAYRLLKRKVRWSGTLISNTFPQFVVIHIVKGFSVVNEAEVDAFQELPLFSMIQWLFAIWSLVPLPLQNQASTSGNFQFTYCWSLAWRSLIIRLLACEMIAIVW